MPEVHFRMRWPDGLETRGYSPSTIILTHLAPGGVYRVDDFMRRAEIALNAASERVYELKGFYCSSAMDTLAQLRKQVDGYRPEQQVQVLDMG